MVPSVEPCRLVTTFKEWGNGAPVESAQHRSNLSGYRTYPDVTCANSL